jgi:molybdopterin adenylyltransferase|tara:strand:+ start:253 stop:741 length:489 start_codon:yes stop_codon:yes gene_type:complete
MKLVKFGFISVSDRASSMEYKDKALPELKRIILSSVPQGYKVSIVASDLIPDEIDTLKEKILLLSDSKKIDILITSGGTGISPRDITPDVTRSLIDKELPGFSEYMRNESIKYTKNAILSRQAVGIRGKTLIINLPGNPNSLFQLIPLICDQMYHCIDELNK